MLIAQQEINAIVNRRNVQDVLLEHASAEYVNQQRSESEGRGD